MYSDKGVTCKSIYTRSIHRGILLITDLDTYKKCIEVYNTYPKTGKESQLRLISLIIHPGGVEEIGPYVCYPGGENLPEILCDRKNCVS